VILKELLYSEYSKLDKVKDNLTFPIISSVLENKQNGKVFFELNNQFEIIFIFHKSNYSYLIVEGDIRKAYYAFFEFVKVNIDLPKYFHVYDCSDEFINLIDEHVNYRIRERIKLKYTKGRIELSPVGNEVKLVDITELNTEILLKSELNIYTSFWNDIKDLQQNGFGVVLINNTNPVAICYSASIGHNSTEVDIKTRSGHEGKGYGKIITQAFVNMSVERNLIPEWDCFSDNVPSIKIAKHIGFEMYKTYKFISLFYER
jgi:RimJ/RimL family protein N-acetyltransferase